VVCGDLVNNRQQLQRTVSKLQTSRLLSAQGFQVLVQAFEDFVDNYLVFDAAVPAGDDFFGAGAEV
jgi:hypothetical protein